MGFVDNIKNIFFKGSVEVARTTPEKTSDIFKAYIPEFLYKPPFGYPRKANLPLLRQLSETPYVFAVIKTLCDEASSLEWDIQVKEEIENPEQYDEKTQKKIRTMVR